MNRTVLAAIYWPAVIRRRLDDMDAAGTLEDMRHLPGRCHELRSDRDGQLSLDLVHPQRLIFPPADKPVPTKPDGGLDRCLIPGIVMLFDRREA